MTKPKYPNVACLHHPADPQPGYIVCSHILDGAEVALFTPATPEDVGVRLSNAARVKRKAELADLLALCARAGTFAEGGALMYDWRDEEIRKARIRFFNGAVEFFRRTSLTSSESAGDVHEAWDEYSRLLSERESDALVNPPRRASRLESVLNFLWFWRSDRNAVLHRRRVEKIIEKNTPPSGGGGPWG